MIVGEEVTSHYHCHRHQQIICTCMRVLGYPPMALFLNMTGRPIALSCEYALYQRGSQIKVRNILF